MTDTVAMNDRVGELCRQFRLPTMSAQSVARLTAEGHSVALPTFLEVLEQEAEDRRQQRISRLRTASRLPVGKTWETFDHDRVPLALRQQLGELADGNFVERGINVLAFGLPGTGKTHALGPLGHRLVESGRSVLLLLPTVWRRTCWPPSATSHCRNNYDASTPTTFCCWTTWDTCPREPRSPKCSSPLSPSATNAGPWVSHQTRSSPSGSTSSPTQWPPPRPSTVSSITRSSWNLMSPATEPEWLNRGVRSRR